MKKEIKETNEDVIEHVVTEQDIEMNPGSDLVVGETVEIPAVEAMGIFRGKKVVGSPEVVEINGLNMIKLAVEDGTTYTVSQEEFEADFK